jgi:hypothetical protein
MIKQTKLKPEELQELQDFQQKSEFLISQLGQLQFKKLQIEKEELILKNSFDHITKLETELSEKLKTLYGDISIDLKTGEIIYS